MPEERHRSYFPQDDAPSRSGDLHLWGVDTRVAPTSLEPGLVANATNARFTFGAAQPRAGIAKLPWTNRVLPTNSGPQPLGTIHGATSYSNPLDRLDWLVIAAEGKVYRCRQNNGLADIPLPAGVTLSGEVSFAQTKQGLIMFRGESEPPLIMPSFDAGWRTISQQANTIAGAATENPSDGTELIPNAERGDYIANRLFIAHRTQSESDLLLISDYLNPTRYAPVRSQARINQGSNDRLLRVVQMSEQVAICFKTRSIYALTGVAFDLSQMRLESLIQEYGLCGVRTPVVLGADLWFLAPQRGVVSIVRTEQNKLQAADIPMSAPMQRVVERIHWDVAAKTATAAFHDNKYYLAVPLDDALACGANMAAGTRFNASGYIDLPIRPNQRMQWVKGGAESIVLPIDYVADSGVQFELTDFTIRLEGPANQPVTSQVCEVYPQSNNAVLVYDTLTARWAGVDTGPAGAVREWVLADYEGVQRLMFLGQDGFVNLVGELFWDETAHWGLASQDALSGVTLGNVVDVAVQQGRRYRWSTPDDTTQWTLINGTQTFTGVFGADFTAEANTVRLTHPDYAGTLEEPGSIKAHQWRNLEEWIQFSVRTRAYGGEAVGRKKWQDLEAHVRTWHPRFKITATTDGVQGQVSVHPADGAWATASPTRYRKPWDAAPWDPTNWNGDFATEHREDYAQTLTDTPVTSGQIQAGIRYFVESADVTSACSITYAGNTIANQELFVGQTGATSFVVTSGTPVVYGPGSYLFMGTDGVDMDRLQENVLELRVPPAMRGRGVQFELTCTQGVAILAGIAPSGIFTGQGKGLKT